VSERPHGYVPAASYDWLLPLYDPVLRWVMREDIFKRRLVEAARIGPGQRVLDLGCGTATLTLLAKRLHPAAELVGLDGDPKVLEIARRKVGRAGLEIRLDEGLCTALPYPEAHFDRVLSCLVLHHLTREEKERTLAEVRRVLRPGGSLHVVDFGPPRSAWGRALVRVFHHGDRLGDNLAGFLPDLFREAGFIDVDEPTRFATLAGALVLVQGAKPMTAAP
jgi:ubiquinone/menaquinone biosynthesis C-methylase UbiE